MDKTDSFEKSVQMRLRLTEKNWVLFTMFYFVKDAPATNKGVENYYSTSVKTHRKKQFRSDMEIENQMKLSAMKGDGLLGRCKKTPPEAFLMSIVAVLIGRRCGFTLRWFTICKRDENVGYDG